VILSHPACSMKLSSCFYPACIIKLSSCFYPACSAAAYQYLLQQLLFISKLCFNANFNWKLGPCECSTLLSIYINNLLIKVGYHHSVCSNSLFRYPIQCLISSPCRETEVVREEKAFFPPHKSDEYHNNSFKKFTILCWGRILK